MERKNVRKGNQKKRKAEEQKKYKKYREEK